MCPPQMSQIRTTSPCHYWNSDLKAPLWCCPSCRDCNQTIVRIRAIGVPKKRETPTSRPFRRTDVPQVVLHQMVMFLPGGRSWVRRRPRLRTARRHLRGRPRPNLPPGQLALGPAARSSLSDNRQKRHRYTAVFHQLPHGFIPPLPVCGWRPLTPNPHNGGAAYCIALL
jgi:hypothetical protein